MPTSGSRVGALLGVLNTVFVAIAYSVSNLYGDDRWQTAGFLTIAIVLFGILPGVITGMVLGKVGSELAARHVVIRCAALVLPAIGVMLGYSALFGLASRFALGVIPTVVCALILERATRARSDLATAIVK